ncbi:RHS repeat-associated core domain-containing protein [Pseudomonas violetae]|uniref:RHS repeat-associated core domain-containing protein n=1 Tax=Pseudomonas violetae TaxID=2915813 RepID=A0ABT0EZD7_9PSED|nr:RHS repeat-associated core domain-containing protein [Pseudomonas violetae]
MATDDQRSVLHLSGSSPLGLYGHHSIQGGPVGLLGFKGERSDPVTGHYHLGKGYRQFNPVLMRFNTPDSGSPLGKGGINDYVFCGADPINRSDPSGHYWRALKATGFSVTMTASTLTLIAGLALMVVDNDETNGIGYGLVGAGILPLGGGIAIDRLKLKSVGRGRARSAITSNRPITPSIWQRDTPFTPPSYLKFRNRRRPSTDTTVSAFDIRSGDQSTSYA